MSVRTPAAVAQKFLTLAVVVILAAAVQAQRDSLAPPRDLPPILMTCPMHPDIVMAEAGTCTECKMNLVPVRIDRGWACPIHSVITSDSPGTCRICRRELVPVTVALTWACLAQPNVEHLERGTCSDGSRMILKRTVRPHGDHNPRHGGLFFMAPDSSHHLEGAYPRERVFRLYVYDDSTKPLPEDRMRLVKGRVVTNETWDPATRETREISAFPLRLSRDGSHLEARVDSTSLPTSMTAKVQLKPDGPEYRFDFTFPKFTVDPPVPR